MDKDKGSEARAAPLNPLTDAELQMIEDRQAVGLSVTDTLAKALNEVREARAWRKRMRAAMLDCARDIEKEYPAWARDWREMAGSGNADASPPPDSVSESLREARRLLGEAQNGLRNVLCVSLPVDVSGERMVQIARDALAALDAFLGERSDREQSSPSSPLDPGEQNG